MTDLVEGQIGPETKYEVDFVGGKLVAKLDYAGSEAGGGAYVSINADVVMDKLKVHAIEPLKKAIPGGLDDMLIDMAWESIKAALKGA